MPALPSLTVEFNHLQLTDAWPHGKLGELCIAGTRFYVEAIEVRGLGREESMTAINPDLQGRIDAVAEVDAGGDRPGYSTILDGGAYYFVLIYPTQL